MGAWQIPCSSFGRSGCVAGLLSFVSPRWGRGGSPVFVWLRWGRGGFLSCGAGESWWSPVSCGRGGGVAGPLFFVWCGGGVAGPLFFVWPWLLRGGSPVPCVAAVGAWRVPFFCGRSLGVSGPRFFVGPPWDRGRSPINRVPRWGRGWSRVLHVAAVMTWQSPVRVAALGALLVRCFRGPRWGRGGFPVLRVVRWSRGGSPVFRGRSGGVAAPLFFVWPRWRRGGSPVLRVATAGAWRFPCTL